MYDVSRTTLKTCTSTHYQNAHMRPKQQIKYHKNNTTRPPSKHTNHTTPPSYHNTTKPHFQRRHTTSRNHLKTCTSIHYQNHTHMRPKQLIKYTKITPPLHQNIPTIPHLHLTITLTKPHPPCRRASEPPQNMHFNTPSKSHAHASKTTNQISKITQLHLHQNIPTIPHRHLTITLTKPHNPTWVPTSANHPSKHALQYTIKITRTCVQNNKSNITK